MNELNFQAKVKLAVKEMGGVCFKMSNRFIAGVPDLLIQLPGYPTSLWEVKYVKWLSSFDVTFKATALQKMFLRDFMNAGGLGGIISFIQTKTDFRVCIRTTDLVIPKQWDARWSNPQKEHRIMKRGEGLEEVKRALSEIHEKYAYQSKGHGGVEEDKPISLAASSVVSHLARDADGRS